MDPIEKNWEIIKKLLDENPKKFKWLSSQDDVSLIDFNQKMATITFDNNDLKLGDYLTEQIKSGMEVSIMGAGRDKVLVNSGLNLFIKAEKEEKSSGGGGCFIATAAHGSPLAAEVIYLSQFRDEVLERNYYGRIFVRIYYKISPPIARLVESRRLLRWAIRAILIRPLILGLNFCQEYNKKERP